MELHGSAKQVWIFIGESDKWHGQSLYHSILELLKRNGCAGGTVLKGVAGFGAHSFIHTASIVELSSDLPIAVTFVDQADRVDRVLPEIMAMVNEGLITVLPVEVLKYTHRVVSPFPRHLTVQDIMTRNVVRVLPETPISQIVTLLLDHTVRSVLVVDTEEHVIGIITDSDLLSRGSTVLPLAVQRELPLAERVAYMDAIATQPRSAADVMTEHPNTLDEATPLSEAAAIMNAKHLKRMPVVDTSGHLVGIVSRSDLLKTIVEGLRQRPEESLILPDQARTAGDVMLQHVTLVQQDTPLAETLDRLLEDDRRCVLVVDMNQQIIGIITDADVLQRAARRVRPNVLRSLALWFRGGLRPDELAIEGKGRTAADIMTSPVITVTAETPLAEIMKAMITHKIKRIPVIDANNRPIGMVGRAGVLMALSRAA